MNFTVTSAEQFRHTLLTQLNFIKKEDRYYSLYQNPNAKEQGHLLLYERPGYYYFAIANYTIPHAFSIHFNNPKRLIRLGTVYKGITQFQLENKPVSSFTPSSFFVVEKDLIGTQTWHPGQHFQGAEITIYEEYFNEVIAPLLNTDINFEAFTQNYTYHCLPLEVMSIIQNMQKLSAKNKLDPLKLESSILDCVSLILSNIEQSPHQAFTHQMDYGKVKIGDRYLKLTADDIQSIQKAHDLLIENLTAPPTIEKLSELVMLNPQKLKAGFHHHYHMTIGEFIINRRLSIATHLLCTTDMSIAEIAKHIGYPYPSNFIKAFKKVYHCTPLQYKNKR